VFPANSNSGPAEPSIEAIAAGWQELARQLRFLQLRGTPVPLEQALQLQCLVARSAESIRAIATGLAQPSPCLEAPGMASNTGKLMLASGAPGSDGVRLGDGIDRAPGRGYKLLLGGSGSTLPAQDVVRLIGARRLQGVLKLRTSRETFTLEFESGEIAHMHTNLPLEGERLGEILVRCGVFDAQQLESIRARDQRGRIGEVLLNGKHVTQGQLLSALEMQVHLLVGRLCLAQAENFSFWAGPLVLASPRQRIAVAEVMLVSLFDEGGPLAAG
jgi:hypothetical protein